MPNDICRADFVVREDYRVLARCEVEIEVPEGHPNIALFYQKTAGAAVRWSEEVLAKKVKNEYALLPDVWAKARFLPYRFSLRGKIVFEDPEIFVMVCRSVFSRGSERQARRSAQVWNKREGTILPNRLVLRRFGGKKTAKPKGFRVEGCYPVGGEMVFFRNPTAKNVSAEKKIKIISQ